MNPSKLLLIIILFFCTTIFGQTTEKETPQKTFTYGVTLIYFYQDGRNEQIVIKCPLKDEECLLLNEAENVETVFDLVDKILQDVLPKSERGKSAGVFTPESGGSVRRYEIYEYVHISTVVARHPKFHLINITLRWQEVKIKS